MSESTNSSRLAPEHFLWDNIRAQKFSTLSLVPVGSYLSPEFNKGQEKERKKWGSTSVVVDLIGFKHYSSLGSKKKIQNSFTHSCDFLTLLKPLLCFSSEESYIFLGTISLCTAQRCASCIKRSQTKSGWIFRMIRSTVDCSWMEVCNADSKQAFFQVANFYADFVSSMNIFQMIHAKMCALFYWNGSESSLFYGPTVLCLFPQTKVQQKWKR